MGRQLLAHSFDAEQATDDGRLDRGELLNGRMVRQTRQFACGGQGLAQSAELIDQLVLYRLLTGPNAALTDGVDLLLGELAALGDALQKHVIELPHLAL